MVVAAWAGRVAELWLESGRSLREWEGGNVGTGTRENRGFLRVIAIVCSFQLVTHRNWKPPPPPDRTQLHRWY